LSPRKEIPKALLVLGLVGRILPGQSVGQDGIKPILSKFRG